MAFKGPEKGLLLPHHECQLCLALLKGEKYLAVLRSMCWRWCLARRWAKLSKVLKLTMLDTDLWWWWW